LSAVGAPPLDVSVNFFAFCATESYRIPNGFLHSAQSRALGSMSQGETIDASSY
jgi:hypothetical protein